MQTEMSDRNVIAQIELQIEMSDVRKICRLKCQKQGQKRKEETMNLNSRNYGLLLKVRGRYLWHVLSVEHVLQLNAKHECQIEMSAKDV